jgi:cellulose synthase/poly-beta-1,6-N-acetylglucosamine synthase-like glycosyltransferase
LENEKLKAKLQIDQALLVIDELLKVESVDAAYKKYVELMRRIESNEYETDSDLKATVYASFAYFLFGVAEYEHFFNMLIKAQENGYSRDEIKKVLLEAFIEPNLNEFKTTYQANIEFLLSNQYIEKSVSFQELPYWLLPSGVANEYYMYDKEQKLIKEKISLYTYQNKQLPPTSDAFSDYLLLESWNWNSILTNTNALRKEDKKTYIVLDDIGKSLACLQGALLNKDVISNVLILDSLSSMNEYFASCNASLPRNIIDLVNKNEEAQNIIHETHNDRIIKEKRTGDHILLSICIPSYNRGKRAYDNVIHLLKTYYDEEIEIVVSNNGTQNETKEFYDKIRGIDDVRLNYFSFEENQGFSINVCKVCEVARGKFILLISDEDLVDLNVLDKIMNMLSQTKETLAIVKTSTTSQGRPPSFKTAKLGKDALLTYMLTSNYMSGIILNNELLKQHRGLEYIRENLDNSVCLWYPHMFLELLLSQYGNVQGTELILIHEGKAEKTDFDEKVIRGSELKMPYYATIDGRLEQHEGFSKIFMDLEICKVDFDLFREMYIKLCAKTFFLVNLSINFYYKNTDNNPLDMLERAYHICAKAEFYKTHTNSNRNSYRRDLEVINKQYEHFKNQI